MHLIATKPIPDNGVSVQDLLDMVKKAGAPRAEAVLKVVDVTAPVVHQDGTVSEDSVGSTRCFQIEWDVED